MPNKVEVILQINIDKVSCPGVWLCQDGRVALLVFALGAGYQTRYLPPAFPLHFKDTFYFKKEFSDLCTLENLNYLLSEETIYCELIQISDFCGSAIKPIVLAQYLGSLSEVLFPPNVCITDGVDLLMKRTDKFPGILAPKIEISTRVRIDQQWNTEIRPQPHQTEACRCTDGRRQTVCHSPQYHRVKCARYARPVSATRSRMTCNKEKAYECGLMRPRSRSPPVRCRPPGTTFCMPPPNSNYCRKTSPCVYRVDTPKLNTADDVNIPERDTESSKSPKTVLESRYVANDDVTDASAEIKNRSVYKQKLCTCDICKRYYQMFHDRPSSR